MATKVYHYQFKEIKINRSLSEKLRNIKLKELESINIMRLGEDLVLSDGRVPNHTDGTKKGKNTIMLVLLTDNGFTFNHESCEISINPGDIIRFNGNKRHGLYCNKLNGRFAALIWDVKLKTCIDDLLLDFINRLKELNKSSMLSQKQFLEVLIMK